MVKIGLALIGNSPRGDDLIDEIEQTLPPYFEVIQKGALDGLDEKEIADLAPNDEDQDHVVTILNSGNTVILSKKKIIPLMQKCIKELEDCGTQINVIMCTGNFPNFETKNLIVEPQKILFNLVKGLLGDKRLGVFVPLPSQINQSKKEWQKFNIEPVVHTASPYETMEELKSAAEKMKTGDVDLVIMNCFGYSNEMSQIVKDIVDKPVILARSMMGRIIADIF
jgi:protein AroM